MKRGAGRAIKIGLSIPLAQQLADVFIRASLTAILIDESHTAIGNAENPSDFTLSAADRRITSQYVFSARAVRRSETGHIFPPCHSTVGGKA